MKKLIVILISAIGLHAMAQEKPQNLNVLAFNGLNMRSQPDSKSRVVTKVPYGKQVEILEKTEVELQLGWIKDNWYKVRFRGREGYIFGGYLGMVPAPVVSENVAFADLLSSYCTSNFQPQAEAINAIEKTRNGDTLFYTLQKLNNGVELELEELQDRKTTMLLLPLSVQQTYVLLESMLKSSSNVSVLDELRFVKGKDGALTRISNADGSVSIKSISSSQTALKIVSYSDTQSAQR